LPAQESWQLAFQRRYSFYPQQAPQNVKKLHIKETMFNKYELSIYKKLNNNYYTTSKNFLAG
ncbi:MAG: hypothetical protein PF441_10005, partial [Desulfuromusa sp.]|nr:hypothetical protein [Desulfuromusa sp.]